MRLLLRTRQRHPLPLFHQPAAKTIPARFCFSSTSPAHTLLRKMEVQLSAPNGKKWAQPLGLFVNNEFVKSSNDQKLASINPA